MKEYQLFILTLEGSLEGHYALKCADDADARKAGGFGMSNWAQRVVQSLDDASDRTFAAGLVVVWIVSSGLVVTAALFSH